MISDLFKNIPVTKIFGTAGAGKTTKLIEILDSLFKEGVSPERIAFASFTNKAVDEMVERITVKFSQFNEKQFFNFKTIHAMGYASSSNKKIMKQSDLGTIAKSLGLEISYMINAEDCGGNKTGDKAITVESLARLRMVSLEQQWKDCRFEDLPYHTVLRWEKALLDFKKINNVIDFTDLLSNFNGSALDVDYIFIDEAQDLCPLQWHVLNKLSANCQQIYIAGDDDQLIYKWAGADVEYILNIKAEEEIILAKSYRLPANIYKLTRSILRRISKRKPKECQPTKEDGQILRLASLDNIVFDPNQDYLILIRNRFFAKAISEKIEAKGLPYVSLNQSSVDCDEIKAIFCWEKFRKNKVIDYKDFEKCKKFSYQLRKYDREEVPLSLLDRPWFEILNLISPEKSAYFRIMLGKGFKLSQEPKIKISTIHQAKGGECDNVIVMTDVSYNTLKNINSDDEHRVWYVATSRAKKNLTIVRGQTDQNYKI